MDKEAQEAMKRVFATPIGAGKRFLVKCGGQDVAGFDTRDAASAYVTMQTKDKAKQKAPACSKLDWNIVDRG